MAGGNEEIKIIHDLGKGEGGTLTFRQKSTLPMKTIFSPEIPSRKSKKDSMKIFKLTIKAHEHGTVLDTT